MIVLHYTAMDSANAALERMCDPIPEVSAHYLIDRDGTIVQMVSEDMRAWHAGAGAWGEIDDVNSHSIGIELDYCPPFEGTLQYDERQIKSLENLLSDILRRRPEITIDGIIGHSDLAPARKFDPGPMFPWQHFSQAGLAIWPKDVADLAPDWDVFKKAAKVFGYRPPSDDPNGWDAVLFAFRSRFLSGHVGKLSERDMGVILALARQSPCAKA
jgi:N-acetylmuramoyl-L-alanine amidase